jgi:hypothetical protein
MRVAGRRVTRTHAVVGGAVALTLGALTGGAMTLTGTYLGDGHERAVAATGDGAATPWAGSPIRPGSPSPSTSGSASPSWSALGVTADAAAHGGSGARLRQVDGGTGYYAKFRSGLPTSASFFPIAVWYESVVEPTDAPTDKAAGINTYVQLTNTTDLSLIRAQGMHAIPDANLPGAGSETVGWMISDEADMWGGPGASPWTGNYPGNGDICSPADAKCGYTVQQKLGSNLPADGRIRYSNYGKGVTFWDSDSEAARFVNQYQNIVSADNYWFSDQNICNAQEGGSFFGDKPLSTADCHRASNYGHTVDRLRSLESPAGSRPVWGFVEVGHPFTDQASLSITPGEVVAAVWSSIIHGARGIIYFNHSFGGPCQTQHALREPCYASVRAAVTAVDTRIASLAPVLNAPFADNVARGSSGVDVSTKWYGGHFYVLAGSNAAAGQTATFSLPCVGNAQVNVLNENRTLKIAKGTFSDRFADGNAVHIYRVDGGSSCGAY